MATTENTYTGDGLLKTFSFTFPYLEETDIRVSLDGSDTSAYSLANATTIQFNTAPPNGAAVRIYRVTDQAAPPTTFFAGSSIRAQDLNDNFLQTLYVAQETDAIARNLTAGDIAPGSITSLQLADGAVSTLKLADDAVTKAKLETNSVGTDALYSSSDEFNDIFRPVVTDSIKNLAVTTAKIADIAVTTAKIDNEAVTTAKINDEAVTTAKIDDDAVTTAKIDNDAVITAKIEDGAVTRAKTTNPGVVLQVQRTEFTAADSADTATYSVSATQTTGLTEGQTKELMSVNITPKLATSKLLIQVQLPYVSASGGSYPVAGLFQDSGSNAISTGGCLVSAVNFRQNITFSHYMDAGSTSPTTFTVRYGGYSGTIWINTADGTTAALGGTCEASITVTEIAQ
jgi:hypothetical protein